jgi:hypothetical protein
VDHLGRRSPRMPVLLITNEPMLLVLAPLARRRVHARALLIGSTCGRPTRAPGSADAARAWRRRRCWSSATTPRSPLRRFPALDTLSTQYGRVPGGSYRVLRRKPLGA